MRLPCDRGCPTPPDGLARPNRARVQAGQSLADRVQVGVGQVGPGGEAQPGHAVGHGRRAEAADPDALGRAAGRQPRQQPRARASAATRPRRPGWSEPGRASRVMRSRSRARDRTAPARCDSLRSTVRAAAARRRAGRRETGVEDERAGGVDQVLDDDRGRPSTAPPCAPSDLDSVTVSTTSGCTGDAGGACRTRAVRADDAERVGLVDHEQRAVRTCHGVQIGQRREVAVDGEHGVGDDDGPLGGCAATEPARRRRRRGARSTTTLRPRQPAGVDDRGVVERVGHDRGARPGQGGDGPEVGEVARREDQAGLRRRRRRPGRLSRRCVQVGAAGHQPRPGRSGSPAHRRGRRGGRDARVAGQARGSRWTRGRADPRSRAEAGAAGAARCLSRSAARPAAARAGPLAVTPDVRRATRRRPGPRRDDAAARPGRAWGARIAAGSSRIAERQLQVQRAGEPDGVVDLGRGRRLSVGRARVPPAGRSTRSVVRETAPRSQDGHHGDTEPVVLLLGQVVGRRCVHALGRHVEQHQQLGRGQQR